MGKTREPDESELRMNIQDDPIAKAILDVLKRNETSDNYPQNVYAIAGYMPKWWGGDMKLLEKILDGLAAIEVIGVDTGRWKNQDEKWYWYLEPLDRLARIHDAPS
jgi:hypothetical protein